MIDGRLEVGDVDGHVVRDIRSRIVSGVFGDRIGLTLFLGVTLALSLCWRVGFFITDTYAVANTVVNVAEGHFYIRRIEYSLTLGSQPGLYRSGSRVFGRNYAAAILSLPFYWLLEGAAALSELRVVLAAGWSVLAAGFAAQLGGVLDSQRVTLGGTLLALGVFVANLALATPMDPDWTGLLALQLFTLVTAGFVAVVFYRLLATLHGRRVGIAAGVLSALALPVAFWSTIPKRHVFSAALISLVVLSFARSRQADSSPLVRSCAYAAVGILAWLHAAEALAVFVVLLPVDLATAPRNDRRTLAVLGLVFGISLAPFFVTNVAITGNPFETPRMLPGLGDAAQVGPNGRITVDTGGPTPSEPPAPTEPTTTSEPPPSSPAPGDPPDGAPTAPTAPGESDGSPGLIAVVTRLFGGILSTITAALSATPERLSRLWEFVDAGLSILFTDLDRLNHVFLRSGRVPGLRYGINEQEAIELTVLESAPILGTLAVLPILWVRTALSAGVESVGRTVSTLRSEPRYQTDLLAGGIAAIFTLLYLPRLPLFSQITMRYLVPVMPIALYGVLRLPPVRRGIDDQWNRFVRSYLTASVLGIVGVVAVFLLIQPALGEAMQFHALLNLVVAGLVALSVSAALVSDSEGSVADAVGAAGGAGTTLFALAGLEYFTYGTYVFPIARWLSRHLPLF